MMTASGLAAAPAHLLPRSSIGRRTSQNQAPGRQQRHPQQHQTGDDECQRQPTVDLAQEVVFRRDEGVDAVAEDLRLCAGPPMSGDPAPLSVGAGPWWPVRSAPGRSAAQQPRRANGLEKSWCPEPVR